MTSLAKLNSVVSAGHKVKQGLADTAVDELRDEWRTITQDFTAQAKVWFPDGAWNVQDARNRGLLPYIRDAAQAYIDRLANAMVAKVQDSRRKACLSALGAHKVAMAVLGQVQAKSDAQIIRNGPVLESLRILGRRVTVYREADTPDEDEGRWVTIRGRHVFIKHGESPKDAFAKSLGKDGSSAQRTTDSPEFKAWFGNSKVVDKDGKPLVVYHGTASKNIVEFLPDGGDPNAGAKSLELFRKAKTNNEPFGYMNFRSGSFFSPDPNYAGHYTAENTGTMYPVYIKAENPVYFDQKTRKVTGVDPHRTPDALIMMDGGKINEIAVIDPTQIKSKFNRGTWNPKSPKISESKRHEAQREARALMGLSGITDPSITGHNRARLIAAIELYIPPLWWNLPKIIRYRTEADPNSKFDGIHGEWTDGKEIVLNPSIFESKETFGTKDEGQLNRAEHTICHEFCHAYGDSAKLDESPEWLSLSGWQHQTGLTPSDKGRYREKRKGWPKEDSSWVHGKDAWFIRPYSAKSPAEDFADCAMAVIVGWADKFDGGGEAKRDWVVSVLGDVSRVVKQQEADEPIDPKDGRWVTMKGRHVFIRDGVDDVVKITQTTRRVFTGKTELTRSILSKGDTGKLGESVVLAWLRQHGMADARPLNLDRNNFPIDLIQDHEVIEVKAGLVSNRSDTQRWRLTIGEPGRAEKAWLARASDKAKAAWNAKKERLIVERKNKVLNSLSKQLGRRVKARTITAIINPDTKSADLFSFSGWHERIGWNSPQAKAAYVGTVRYR